MDEAYDVVVVGAGIAGLCAAWEAARSGASVVLFDEAEVAGGKIQTVEFAGAHMDAAADAFLARVPWARDLCRDLGIEDELVSPGTGQAWLWVRGRLRRLPPGLVLGVPSRWLPVARSGVLSLRGLARLALDEVRPVRLRADDLSIANAIGAHLGTEAVERLVDPLIGGINAGDSWELSLASVTPQLVTAARAPRLMRALRSAAPASTTSPAVLATSGADGLSPGLAARERGAANTGSETTGSGAEPVFLTPREGMSRVVERLVEVLPEGVLRLGTAVHGVGPGWVSTAAGTIRAGRIVLATPAHVNARLLADTFPAAASLMGSVTYSSVSMVLLGYPKDSAVLPEGSGMLVPRTERRLMSAASWYDQKWPHRTRDDLVVARVSSGKAGDTRHLSMDEDDLVATLHGELATAVRSVTGCSLPKPVASKVVRWPHAFPQYVSGHAASVALLREELSTQNIRLVGATYNGVGIAACVRDGRAAGKP